MADSLVKRMQMYRKKYGITQTEMAKACRLSPNYVSALERGLYQPNAETLIAWAKKCGISIDELVGYKPGNKIDPELEQILAVMNEHQQKKLTEILKIAMKK